MKHTLLSYGIILFLLGSNPFHSYTMPKKQLLAKQEISLEKRHAVPAINEVFKDNILLTLAYMRNKGMEHASFAWEDVREPFHYELLLYPNQAFAFHEDALPEYKQNIIATTNAHFNYSEGFKSDGYLTGDGVCHLASFMNWVAQDAGLDVVSQVNHDFAAIPEVARKYGTSIYFNPGSTASNAQQNLYIRNNRNNPVTLIFDYDLGVLQMSIVEVVENPSMT